jgi:uncharacterized protein YbaR (Trm112 family)
MVSDAARDENVGAGTRAELLDLLVCPACHGPLADSEGHLTCRGCGLRYPIRNGIPVMLPSEALPRERAEDEPEGC